MRRHASSSFRHLGAALVAIFTAMPAHADGPQVDNCLGCHESMAGMHATFEDGSGVSIQVTRADWDSSVHAGKLSCTDCHKDISGFPHEKPDSATARDFQLKASESCQTCHYAYYTRALDGIHYKQIAAGNKAAPTCVDCHGSHAIQDPQAQRIAMQERCAGCHPEVAATYANSVHGKALKTDAAADVPTCTNCHGAHDMKDPTGAEFHASSYQACATCHSDKPKMEKYGLNPNVVGTYLNDFHGTSNELLAMGAGTSDKPIAACEDCHGFHDVQPFDSEGEPEAVQARVTAMCQKCHGDVDDSFSKAWLGHSEPSINNAPAAWALQWVYRLMIPFIILGLVLHILLHLYRLRVHR